jgi:hypothetical protein
VETSVGWFLETWTDTSLFYIWVYTQLTSWYKNVREPEGPQTSVCKRSKELPTKQSSQFRDNVILKRFFDIEDLTWTSNFILVSFAQTKSTETNDETANNTNNQLYEV